MFEILYQFLVLHKKLVLPDLGIIFIERIPATADFANQTITNPSFGFLFKEENEAADRKIFSWLGKVLSISEIEAIIKLNDFSSEFKNSLMNGEVIDWKGIGSFRKGLGGVVKFEPFRHEFSFLQPVPAEKVIREKAGHSVLVGEQERSSEEITERLALEEPKKSAWWFYAFLIGLAAVMFIGIFLSQKGLNISSFSNQQKFIPQDIPAILK